MDSPSFKATHTEEAIIGMMIVDLYSVQVCISNLTKFDFSSQELMILFDNIEEMYNNGKKIDIVTITEHLKNKELLQKIGGFKFIQNLAEAIGSTLNINSYIKIVQDISRRKKLISASNKISSLANNSKESVEEIMTQSEKEILTITRNISKQDFIKSTNFISDTLVKMNELILQKTTHTGFETGYKELDNMTSGFQAGEYIIIAARPSMGKTAFALNLLVRSCEINKKPVAFFSLEMPIRQITHRLLAQKSIVEQGKIKTPRKLSAGEKEAVFLAADEISNLDIYVNDTTPLTMNQIVSNARKLYSDTNKELGCIFIDYLTFIKGNRNRDNRVVEVGDISAGLKSLARELNIPVVVLSQLSRGVEKRESKKPFLSDLRDSGSIEQDADLVMFLYRDGYYNKEADKSMAEETSIIIAKNRNGPVGEFTLTFDPKTGKFT